MALRALGYRVLIKPDPIEETTESGIIIKTDERIEKAARTTGVVVDVGPQAFVDIVDGEPWVSVGDRVLYAKYSSTLVVDPETKDAKGDGEEYVIITDKDILCRLEQGE